MAKSMSDKEKFTSLFSIYEKGLMNYHQVFRIANYSIEYVVRKNRLSREYQLQIVLSIKKNPSFRIFFHEPRGIKQLIEDYSIYFSITDIRILYPLKSYKIKEKNTLNLKPIEERIYFEYYTKKPQTCIEIG